MSDAFSPPAMLDRFPYGLRALVVALILSLALLSMIQQRASLLTNGQEIRLKTVPVDPRDLLRGDYVVLRYDISQLDTRKIKTRAARRFRYNQRAYVSLQKTDDGFWEAVELSDTPPAQRAPGKALIAGYVRRVHAPFVRRTRPNGSAVPKCEGLCQIVYLRYGIEKYFVPEGQGKALEQQRNERRVAVLVRLSRDGQAAISGLDIDGTRTVIEPLL